MENTPQIKTVKYEYPQTINGELTYKHVLNRLNAGDFPVQVISSLCVPKHVFHSWLDEASDSYVPELAAAWEVGLVRCEAHHLAIVQENACKRGFQWAAYKAMMQHAFQEWRDAGKKEDEAITSESIAEQILSGRKR